MIIKEEAARCLLCHAAPCSMACKKGVDPARMIRGVRFENENIKNIVDIEPCINCVDKECEKACIHYDFPIRINEMAQELNKREKITPKADLSIDFLGVHCENPFFLSSSVVASNYDMCAKALNMGWGGIVFKTIGILQPKEVSPRFEAIRKESTPFVGFRNLEQIAEHTLEENLGYLKKLKENFPNKVIVASIMGQTKEEWTKLAKMVTEAGVDIIECNFSCPHMSGDGLGSDVGQDPELVKTYVEYTKKGTHLPVLAKMTPNIGNMEIPAIAAIEGGADGIAAINTIKSILGLDLKNKTPNLNIAGKSSVSGYSGKAVKPIALRFIHDMAKNEKLKNVPFSGMGGIETWHDALEFIALGCSNIQVTTSVMQYGYRIIEDLIDGTLKFMYENGIEKISDMVGMALDNLVPAEELDRNSIIYPSFNRDKCIGCGRCYISCADGGHQAITFDTNNRKPKLLGDKCVGCHLCRLVCPTQAIGESKRIKKIV
ncbi:NAD-dependent dihydropyrimidine dehydrogenase subunit PreA [Defluviitalea phaphyphila]|uniref:NAD-dependent dihydropyrimidine dehydrogenase subunit PreA n=1 Tax=Defluviitalea phaphyphila TaxID=1473580 RepID=UPI000731B1CC|nr:NAD-dependent dihydropyrimidine dehydrogenase subunit PreA [Defluviitalea phaphyphila]